MIVKHLLRGIATLKKTMSFLSTAPGQCAYVCTGEFYKNWLQCISGLGKDLPGLLSYLWLHILTDRKTDRQTDRQMDRQTMTYSTIRHTQQQQQQQLCRHGVYMSTCIKLSIFVCLSVYLSFSRQVICKNVILFCFCTESGEGRIPCRKRRTSCGTWR